ncbi:tlde1 domain-containing protein [Paracraurococcus lichenis]|uniref:DUF2778 domain-containing protein n=1 Tax=Paracraurococcus lichenis TaxID=3064888 RepID=A0ABT9E3K4_9PROT|nr:tlde1 domain-containing protein [Paracraurococcus sp. LOR1-02]MDO9710743.1 DUF2778 domain-containing protein [Paracraurococcus sp. LOR1-02]
MPAESLKPALRAALRAHEIGKQSPYRLFFAAKGKSGASFGFMQGDLAAGQARAQATFRQAMARAGLPSAVIDSLVRRLSVPLITNPLDKAETEMVNAALLAGRDLVDAMDEDILQEVYDRLDTCLSKARAAGRSIDPEAQVYIALWINMTGTPTKLLAWLAGQDPGLMTPVPQPGTVVDRDAIRAYLKATNYFSENPKNFAHMEESVAAGTALLGGDSLAPAAAVVAPFAAAAAAGACYTYEQATGRLLLTEGGQNDLIATGYSGSEEHGGKNNPKAQCLQDVGPLPRGSYTIGAPRPGPSPFSLPLTPDPANDMCGRSAFLIHGDSIARPGTASHGCIILDRAARERIAASGIDRLVVVDRLA